MRAQLEKKLAQREKAKKEEELVGLAKKARDERAGIRAAVGEWIAAPRVYNLLKNEVFKGGLEVLLKTLSLA